MGSPRKPLRTPEKPRSGLASSERAARPFKARAACRRPARGFSCTRNGLLRIVSEPSPRLNSTMAAFLLPQYAPSCSWETWMPTADLRLALSRPLRSWRATTSVVVIAGCGIGLSAVAFSVAYGLLGRHLPFRTSHELVNVWRVHVDGEEVVSSASTLRDWASWTDVFVDVAGVRSDQLDLSTGGAPSRVTTSLVTPNFFDVLGVTPILGRVFSSADDVSVNAAVIGEATWRSLFGASPP